MLISHLSSCRCSRPSCLRLLTYLFVCLRVCGLSCTSYLRRSKPRGRRVEPAANSLGCSIPFLLRPALLWGVVSVLHPSRSSRLFIREVGEIGCGHQAMIEMHDEQLCGVPIGRISIALLSHGGIGQRWFAFWFQRLSQTLDDKATRQSLSSDLVSVQNGKRSRISVHNGRRRHEMPTASFNDM